MTPTEQLNRQRFEEWAAQKPQELWLDRYGFDGKAPLGQDNGDYCAGCTQTAWLAWKAAQPQWQLITTAPRDGRGFLSFYEMYYITHWCMNEEEFKTRRGSTIYPTHWMPLPPAPTP